MKNIKKLNSEQFNFEKLGGIIPAIIQDAETKAVLMLGFMDKAALDRTIKNKKVTFYSRSKKRLWQKGEVSGNELEVRVLAKDCDSDTVLILAKQKGTTCHSGAYSCFGDLADQQDGIGFLAELYEVIAQRKKGLPKNSYTASLFREGLPKILAKIEEESGEVIRSAQNESRTRLIEESADLIYHLLVLLVYKDISLEEVVRELKRRGKGAKLAVNLTQCRL
jgi:phosphoribosyl-ATP pyrophosphohydrolase/phosphoribosyl-AMP cyclohydrolase